MRFKALVALILFVNIPYIFCQENPLSIVNIPADLLKNSNSVVRNEQILIEINAVDKMTVFTTRTVTVLNKLGDNHVFSGESYDENSSIKKQSAIIFNAAGLEIKKFKQKEFEDVSAVGSNDLFNDNRVSYVDYTPISYPYTIVYESEVVSNSTIFIAPWRPVKRYAQSVQFSTYKLVNSKHIPLRVKESNLIPTIKKNKSDFELEYSVSNLPAFDYEYLSPDLFEFAPILKIALKDFSLVGVVGSAENWKEFGKWQFDNLIVNRNNLPQSTVDEVSELTKTTKDPIEKAKLIYEYVQAKTRYISIQLGIGGWMPMKASEVDELGYGDCKALTNYTYSLLQSQGIESYYTIVYAGENKKDLDSEFASMQGNHVILTLPQENENIFLECTSQTHPFNYLGDFTDNRNVLLVKPDGGEIIRTKKYDFSENLQENQSEIFLSENGDFTAKLKIISKGIEYGNTYYLERLNSKDQQRHYGNALNKLKNLEFEEVQFENNKKDKFFVETLNVMGSDFGTVAGKRRIIPLNIYALDIEEMPRYSNRKYPIEILRGKTIKNSNIFNIPEGYTIESIPKPEDLITDFGSLKTEVSIEEGKILMVQTFVLKDGIWDAGKYTSFRDFLQSVRINSNQKAVIIQN
tara:strand:+ start:2013 stop:3914 length:1902 start_codon:yes stop_codon:yes gene_type:complete